MLILLLSFKIIGRKFEEIACRDLFIKKLVIRETHAMALKNQVWFNPINMCQI